ncbi:cilia- and flagella-associated protein 206-like isoform X2 [Halichondria panicea]|uniref:cilia- and flagella-associated protein 206-like isoform X2 n=1 Tax=Halichondria panicea TaxID=6063 RepID=UPI00312BCAB1
MSLKPWLLSCTVLSQVKAAVLDPDNEFNVERTLTKEDVQKLIQTCVSHLLDLTSPALDTVKMQVHFDMNYSSRSEFLQEHRHVLEARLEPIIRDIADTRARSREELEGLYRKIVSYALLRSGLGSPTEIAVVREATAALQSVFPQAELGTFMALSKLDKEKQLRELTSIVTGIRLFNKECGKGGAGIDDLPIILKDALQVTSQSIEGEMGKTLKMVYQLTGVLMEIIGSPHPPPTQPSVLLMKQALINCRQRESFIKVLMRDILTCAEHLDQLEEEFSSGMESLKEIVQSKTAVPTSHVYPLFLSLSQTWMGFQDEVVLLSVLSNLLTSLNPFIQNVIDLTESAAFQALLQAATVLTDDQRREQSSSTDARVNPDKHRKAEFLFPETTKDFEQLPIEFRGYCGYMFTVNDRLLLPANPSIGLLHHRGKYYAFSCKEAADIFAENPDEFLSTAVENSKRSPELIQLLDMHTHFASGTPGMKGGREQLIHAPVTKCDTGTQTDTHFVESNIVKSYEWNEWELRRKAIKLANLRQRITHSVQTDLSHYKRDNTTQVYLPKEDVTQTKREESSSVPKPSTYIVGLRGKDIAPQTVDLTLSIHMHNNITT